MSFVDKLLRQNQHWAEQKKRAQGDFFAQLSGPQKPSAFYLGCCDSRVLPQQFLGTELGELFTFESVANRFDPNNWACMSALEYAVNTLQVAHILVCGHTQCGGIEAATASDAATRAMPEYVARWVAPLQAVYRHHKPHLPESRDQMLCALSIQNVQLQVDIIAELPLLKWAWRVRRSPSIHGLLFRVESGEVEQVTQRHPE